MSTPYQTTPLTKEHLGLYPVSKIIVVRFFISPHYWYAGIVADHILESDKCTIELKTSIRFERYAQKNVWFPEHSIIQISTDRVVPGTKDTVLEFTLTEPQIIVHSVFENGNGITGLTHVEGITHMSYRGQDVIATTKLLENS